MNGWRIVRIPVAWGRRLGIGRNALRRDVDRTESLAVLTAIAVALIAVPFVLMAGTSVHQANLAEAAAQTASRHQTTAVLVADAPTNTGLDAGMGQVLTQGRWHLPSGAERTGQVSTAPGEKDGTEVSIWINRGGQPTNQPLTEGQAFWRGLFADFVIMFGLVCVLGCALAVVRWRLNRRRYAAWDADWGETEPKWTQRTH